MHLICRSSDPVGDAEFAYLEISTKLAQELLKYREIWQSTHEKDHGLYCLEYWDSSPDWGRKLTLKGPEAQVDSTVVGWLEVAGNVLEDLARTDAGTLKVSKTGLLWQAYHKYADRPTPFETQELPWECLQAIAEDRHPFPIDGEEEEST